MLLWAYTTLFALIWNQRCTAPTVSRSMSKIHRLGDVDVTTFYSKEKDREYTTFKVFSFETADGKGDPSPQKKAVDSGEIEPDEDSDLPF